MVKDNKDDSEYQRKLKLAQALLHAVELVIDDRHTVGLNRSGSVALCKRGGKVVGRIYRERLTGLDLDSMRFLKLAALVFEGKIRQGGYTAQELIRLDRERQLGIFEGTDQLVATLDEMLRRVELALSP